MNPQMLTLLRESRGLSGSQLSTLSGVPQPLISKMENGLSPMDADRMAAIASALEYPLEVFNWNDQVFGFGNSAFYHRKQQALAQGTLRRIQAQVNLIRMRLVRLLKSIEVDTRFTLPVFDVDEMGGPARVAQAVRAKWLLPLGPVRDMMTTLEQAGIVVVQSDFGTQRISAIGFGAVGACPPTIILNSEHSADRARFTCAHELGHLVMHADPAPSETAEAEADAFAAEFLMPERDIRSELKGINLAKAAQMKAAWRVSIAVLIRRARDLKVIDDSRYKSLNVLMSQRGWRKIEPVEIPRESPSVVPALLKVHLEDHRYSRDELAKVVGLYPAEFFDRFEIEPAAASADPKKMHLSLVT